MKKKSFSLIEVIIAISLLSIVIITVLKIKENNFSNINKLNNINYDTQLLSIASIYINTKDNINKHFYLNTLLDKTYDDFNKILKNTKIFKKSEIIDTKKIEIKTISTIKTNYKIKDKISKNIYTFKIEDK